MKQSYLVPFGVTCIFSSLAIVVLSGCAGSPASVPTKEDTAVIPRTWHADSSKVTSSIVNGTDTFLSRAIPIAPPVEYFGTAVNSKLSKAEAEKKSEIKNNPKSIELNFQDADVRLVIGSVLGDMLKLNYSIDPAVQGKITLRTGHPILADSALPALEAALTTVSAAIIVQEGSVQVVPLDNAVTHMRRAQQVDPSQRQLSGFAVEIVPVRYVSPKEIQRVLESFAPKGSILQADDVHNHLVIAGTSQDRAAMVQTIEGFDTDAMQGMNFALFKIEQTSPEQMISELRQIFQPPLELVTQRVRMVPIPRLQSILGISKYRADLEMLESWVRKLDGVSKTGDKKLYVYNVQNGSSKDLAKSLQLVINGATLGPLTAGRESGASSTPTSASSGKEAGAPLAESPAAFMAPTALQSSQGANQSRIVANEENNSLLVFATEQEYHVMRDALRQLDVMPRQVMIEAILAEVTLGDNLRYGVQWIFNSGENTMTLSGSNAGGIDSQFPGFSYIYSGAANARLVLNALQARTDVKVLSAPKLAVLNNQQAELLVGDQIPVLTQTSQGTSSAGAPVIASVQMHDTGVSLTVTPRISDNGNVILDVTQEVSDVTSTTSSAIDSPTIQRRKLHTVIATRDGATVALGGLIRETKSNGNSGVPWLSGLPVVGNLFRSKTIESTRTELIVLLVPHVMRDHAETQAVVDSLLDSMPTTSEFTNHAIPLLPKPKK